MMKLILTNVFIFMNILVVNAQFFSNKDSINPKKYSNSIDVDVHHIFINRDQQFSLKYRRKRNNSRFVYFDRSHYWIIGLNFNGFGIERSNERRYNNTHNILPYARTILSIGHETIRHFGRFNVYYGFNTGFSYVYADYSNAYAIPDYTSHFFKLNIFAHGGVRYFLNNRFSIALETMPLNIGGIYYRQNSNKYYNSSIQEPVYKDIRINTWGLLVTQQWLRQLALSYHF